MADAPHPDAVSAADPGAELRAPRPQAEAGGTVELGDVEADDVEAGEMDGVGVKAGAAGAEGLPAGETATETQVAGAARTLPAPQLPVVDLIGLRFSLQHLRLVGYGLLAVWTSEIVNLLTSPRLAEIGTRLHYTSQFLDLSPILLVAIGLIAFQGGLRRQPLEVALLPLLLALLPLLSALHFFLAPVSVANVVTLVQKQQQIGLDQIEKIDQQIDRASTILRESESIDNLLEGLQRIPGLQVRVPPKASVSEARQEVRRSLERERDRLRERIEGNLSASREAFLRRACTNALLALVVGLLVWGLHHGAMREMEQSIPFLDWVLVHGEQQQPEALQQLLRFQRACVALGWFSLLERCLRLVRKVVRRPSAEEQAEETQSPIPTLPPPNPFDPPVPRSVGITYRPLPLFAGLRPSLSPVASLQGTAAPGEGEDELPDPLAARMRRSRAAAERREERRRRQDLDRYRALRSRMEREGRDPFAIFASRLGGPEAGASDPTAAPPDGSPPDGSVAEPPWPVEPADNLSPRQRRRLERDRRRAHEALSRMADSDAMLLLEATPEDLLERELAEELEQLQRLPVPPQAPPRGLAGLWRWFLTHL